MRNSITNINEYIDWIEECYKISKSYSRPLFFRGHGDIDWKLTPSILRTGNNDKKNFSEKEIILDYKQVFSSEVNFISDLERILVKMQHHQIPTRLLDWSISPLTALFFACSTGSERDGKVYVINPWKFYQKVVIADTKKIPALYFEMLKEGRLLLSIGMSFEEISNYCRNKYDLHIFQYDLKFPLPIVGRYLDPRVRFQQGCFVLWGKDSRDLEAIPYFNEFILSCDIPSQRKSCLLHQLSKLGINEFLLKSDLEGFREGVLKRGGIFRI